MKSKPGTYALILRSCKRQRLRVGRWQEIGVEPAYYIYVGSAFGPGGVKARLNRHFRDSKATHWHIDYLREISIPVGACVSYEPIRLEHRWAQKLIDVEGIRAIPKFGCSDCRCHTHLFSSTEVPHHALFAKCLGGNIEAWTCDRAV